jgi:hypothetical protein
VPNYEYIMPTPREVAAEALSKEELKVGLTLLVDHMSMVV